MTKTELDSYLNKIFTKDAECYEKLAKGEVISDEVFTNIVNSSKSQYSEALNKLAKGEDTPLDEIDDLGRNE